MLNIAVQIATPILLILISIIAWFIKKEITTFGARLDRHETIILSLVGDVQRLIGMSRNWNGRDERRRN